jgi:hypothetical protein
MVLNTTAAVATGATRWNSTTPTSTVFSVGTDATVNASGGTYVAYLFAHDAGGFGLTGTDNVISCGSFTTDGSGNASVNLGYEPQYLLVKATGSSDQWAIVDVMRGFSQTQYNQLSANLSAAESTGGLWNPTATGFFYGIGAPSANYIYIAIRRGPMKVPTDATKVFRPISTPPSTTVTAGFVPDFSITKQTDNGAGSSSATYAGSRLQGNGVYLSMSDPSAEGAFGWSWDSASNRFSQSSVGTPVYSDLFGRAPSFMDVVCYTGTGSNTTITHNLAAVPELIFLKSRSSGIREWQVYSSSLANTEYLVLNTIDAKATDATKWNSTTPTSSVFSLGTNTVSNQSGGTYAAYLFSTCIGVSKVGSYTGTGATQTINCGFTGGARFVMIKRTDSTGNWWYFDTARGMVAGNDSRLPINDTTPEVISNWVYTTTGGFQIVTTNADVNASGGSYIFLAIA